MLQLALLILLTLSLCLFVKRKLGEKLLERKGEQAPLKEKYDSLVEENLQLKKENSDLERLAEETIALYDITQEVCKTLDEQGLFKIFQEHIHRYIEAGECEYLQAGADLSEYQADTLISLAIDKNIVGYLAARNIKIQDRDKFQILAQQFLLGLKRALLYRKVQELAITDNLTQAFSRRYFLERLEEEAQRSRKFKRNLSFLMADIDHFKKYNDDYGHLVGDAVLREVGRAIKENIRQVDFMGRYGGEELSVVLTETGKEEAHFAAERIRQAIESKAVRAYDEELKVTVSIGISTFPEDAKDLHMLIDRADQAMYQAKRAGRNRVCLYGKP